MNSWTRRLAIAFCVLLVACFAHGPSLKIGLHGEELEALAKVDGAFGGHVERGVLDSTRALFSARDQGVGPLAFGSLAVSAGVWRGDGAWDIERVPALRIEHMLILLFGAVFLGLGVRRALLPWTGSAQAGAAGVAVCALLAVHPLAGSLVVSVAARGELCALALASAAGFAFLRGRQDRRYRWTVAAVLLCAAAGFCSEAALLLAPALAVCELFSARRNRPLAVRARTAGTTLVVFTGAVFVERMAAGLLGVPLPQLSWIAALQDLARPGGMAVALAGYGEKLGLLFLPSNALVLGLAGTILCGLVLLCGLQPALIAARSAPRLWGWFHLGWILTLLLALFPILAVDVRPDELTQGRALLAGTMAMCIGLAVSATGVSGMRRTLLPAVAVIGYALVARADLRPWERCSDRVIHLAADLDVALREHGGDVTYFVLDPPQEEYGLRSIESALPFLLHPSFSATARERGAAPLVRGLSHAAWRALTREPELDDLRASGLVLVHGDPRVDWGRPRVSTKLPPADPSTGPSFWRGEGRSPALDLDPLEKGRLVVRALPGTDTSERPVLHWRGRSRYFEDGELEGLWIADPDGPTAVFDLAGSLLWQISGRVRRVWFSGSLTSLVVAEIAAGPPPLGEPLRPLVDERGGWFLDPLPDSLPTPIDPEHEPLFRLALFDPAALEVVHLPVALLVRSQDPLRRTVTVEGAADVVAEAVTEGRTLLWSLDYHVDGCVLGRYSGWRGPQSAGSDSRPLVTLQLLGRDEGAVPGGR